MTVQKMCFFNKQIIAIYILNLRLLLISSGFWQCLWRRWWRHRALHQALWLLRLHIPVEGVSCLHQILGAGIDWVRHVHPFVFGRSRNNLLELKISGDHDGRAIIPSFPRPLFYMMSFTQSKNQIVSENPLSLAWLHVMRMTKINILLMDEILHRLVCIKPL